MDRGDLIQVDWLDVHEDVTADPNHPTLSKRRSFGIYWSETQVDGIPCLVTTTTTEMDAADTSQSGFCCYPTQCVKSTKLIKKARKSRILLSRRSRAL